jgi:hypothetical protein
LIQIVTALKGLSPGAGVRFNHQQSRQAVQAGETAMRKSNQRINRHNSRDEWTLTLIAIAVPIASLLSITL